MAFALFAGLTSCDKKGSMKELTVETSLICGDSVAQFKCTFSPTVSNGYFVFYSEERISADQHNEAFEQLYGIYETYKESKTLYSFWLEPGQTYYLYAMTFKEDGGKATLCDVTETQFSTPPSNNETQNLDVEYDSEQQKVSIVAPTGYNRDYDGKWKSTISVNNKSYELTVELKYFQTALASTSYSSSALWINENNRFDFKINWSQVNPPATYTITAAIPVVYPQEGYCDVFQIYVSVRTANTCSGVLSRQTFESPIKIVPPGIGPIAF